MSWKRGLLIGLGAVALLSVFFVLSGRNRQAPVASDKPAAAKHADARKARAEAAGDRELKTEAPHGKKTAAAKDKKTAQKTAAAVQAAAAAKKPAPDAAKATAAEQAVAKWEALVDGLVESKDLPTKESMSQVKETFDKLSKADQMDAINRALNLLPDSQFPTLYGILFDKGEDSEVLDAIFSDALNRPEDIKVPIMKELVQDKQHPMFFESARILDVTGELDNMTGKAGADEDESGAMQDEAATQ